MRRSLQGRRLRHGRAPRHGRPSRHGRAGAAVAVLLGLSLVSRPAMAGGLTSTVVQPVAHPEVAARILAQARWQQVVDVFGQAVEPADPFYAAADAASRLAVRAQTDGWRSPQVPGLVAAVAATTEPDGGYGLAQPWDAYQDGTVNPATTSYTATTAGHVGPVLLAGYLAGAVPAQLVNRAIDSILGLPRSYGGTCIPYSNSPYDLGQRCVWNVHFGAAAFVLAASRATGWRRADADALVRAALTWLPRLPQNPVTGYWAYSSAGGAAQDIGHQLWTATSIDYLEGNGAALTAMLGRPLWRAQAAALHDINVASAMSGIALADCRFALDPTVLTYATSTAKGAPYVFKAISAQAVQVVHRCFAASGDSRSHVMASVPWPLPAPAALG
jgi:hypothetical protein